MRGVFSLCLKKCLFPKIRGTLVGGSYFREYNILGSILGSPYFGKLPNIGVLDYFSEVGCRLAQAPADLNPKP